MSSLLDILPIVTILAMGAGVWWIIGRFQSQEFRKTELFNVFLMLGTFVLIFPLTLIGIQPSGILSLNIAEDVLNVIDFRGYCMIYYLLALILAIISCYYLLGKILAQLQDYELDLNRIRDYKLFLIIFLLLDYLILELILPLRGFDAFYYYLSEAEVFYQAGRITEVNYLSFLPVVKSPLNVLLYVYSYYITGELSIQLIPFLFLLGLVALVYDFALEFFDNHSIGLMAAIFTLVLPFTFWLMNYWAFYQDLYFCYFFSTTCYFSLKWYKSPFKLTFGSLIAIGLILSLLTKITAWILPLILVLWLPTGLRGKKIRIGILLILGSFLCIQAAIKIFIGIIFPILLLFGATCYFITKEKSSDKHSHTLLRSISICIGIFFGSFWILNRMSLSSLVWEQIFELYFSFSNSIKWSYIQPLNPLLHSLEKMHRVNFISAIGLLLLGTGFVLPWIILKLYAFVEIRPITPLLIWLFVFFGIWSAYYLNGSIRYLSPIITPMILCISWGFYQLSRKIDNKGRKDFTGILVAFLGCLNIYYLIPINSFSISDQTQEKIGLIYNQAALNYYLHPEFLILQAIIFAFVLLVCFEKNPLALITKFQIRNTNRLNRFLSKMNQLKNRINLNFFLPYVNFFLLVITIIIPLAVQAYLLYYTHGDFVQFQAIHEYEYRGEYQDVVTILQQQNKPFSGIMTVRTPGFQFFTGQPVIDIYYQPEVFPGNPFVTNTNLTELIEILRSPLDYIQNHSLMFVEIVSIQFIVVPSVKNLYYDIYIEKIQKNSIFFQSLNNDTFFMKLYENSDFELYEVNL